MCIYGPPPRPSGDDPVKGNFLYTLQTGLELAAFYRLRMALPGLRRPYRVPGGPAGAALAMLLPCLTLLVVTMTVAAPAIVAGSAIAAGTVVAARIIFRRRNLGAPSSSSLPASRVGEEGIAHEEARAVRGEGEARGTGAGLVWDVLVPRLGEREDSQIRVVGNVGAEK